MPHFYLHHRDCETLLKDPDGREFRSLDDQDDVVASVCDFEPAVIWLPSGEHPS
jgi:hypothetical protein